MTALYVCVYIYVCGCICVCVYNSEHIYYNISKYNHDNIVNIESEVEHLYNWRY